MAAIRFEAQADQQAARVSFVPLIDIVLQIICFYLFVSAGVQAYQDTSVELPQMTADAMAGELPAELTINITADGNFDINGQAVNPAGLEERLLAEKLRAVEANQRLMVAIRADRRQQYGLLDRALQACREAQVGTVSIRALSGSRFSASGGAP